jgi:hypothetical protein
MKINRYILIILVPVSFLLAIQCEKNESGLEKFVIGNPSFCKIGRQYCLSGGLTFSIDSISDYRCPQDVECIWSGDVDLLFNINLDNLHVDTLIHVITRWNNPFKVLGYSWEVLEVSPLLNSGQKIDRKDYDIKILIQKAETLTTGQKSRNCTLK